MKSAKSQSIAHDGLALRLGVRNDVGRVEELVMLQAAQRTLMAIGLESPFADSALM